MPLTPAQRSPLWRRAMPAAVRRHCRTRRGLWRVDAETSRPARRHALGDHAGPGPHIYAGSSLDGAVSGRHAIGVRRERPLYLRAFDRLDAAPIAGSKVIRAASPRSPFFSPDGQWVGFWQAAQLKKVSVSGGAPVPCVHGAQPPFGASWAGDNTILIGKGTERHLAGVRQWRHP